jgi:hypothetical protein
VACRFRLHADGQLVEMQRVHKMEKTAISTIPLPQNGKDSLNVDRPTAGQARCVNSGHRQYDRHLGSQLFCAPRRGFNSITQRRAYFRL